MKYFRIIYNTSLWAMALAMTCFRSMWLEMRINTGYVFYAAWIVLALLLSILFRNKGERMQALFSLINLMIWSCYGLVLYGIKRIQVVPASIIREGIHRTRMPFSSINKGIIVFLLCGYVLILVTDRYKRNR